MKGLRFNKERFLQGYGLAFLLFIYLISPHDLLQQPSTNTGDIVKNKISTCSPFVTPSVFASAKAITPQSGTNCLEKLRHKKAVENDWAPFEQPASAAFILSYIPVSVFQYQSITRDRSASFTCHRGPPVTA